MKSEIEKFVSNKFFPLSVYGTLFTFLIWLSWLKWPDPWVDFGYFLYHAWRVAQGAKIGIDLSYPYGPLAIHFYALIFKIFGPSIVAVFILNFLLLLGDIFLIHRIFERYSKYVAIVGTAIFIALFSLGQFLFQGNQNLLAPYKPDVALGTFIVLLFIKIILRESITPLFISVLGVLFSFMVLMTTETTLAALLILLVFFFTRWPGWKNFLIFLVATLPSFLFFWIYLMNWEVVFSSLSLLKNRSVVFLPLYNRLMGIDQPIQSLISILEACGSLAFFASLFFILGNLKKSKIVLWSFSIVVILLAYLFVDHSKFWVLAAKPLSLFCLVGIGLWMKDRKKYFFLGIWSAFSLAMMIRIFFNPIFHYYGFTLAFPATLLAIYLFGEVLPSVVEEHNFSGAGLRVFIGLVVFLLIGASLQIEWPLYRHRNFVINYGKNVLIDWEPQFSRRGLALQELLIYLHENLKPGEVLLGVPDGHIINYLLKSPRPGPYSLSPSDFAKAGEEKIIESFEAGKPRFVFSVTDESYDDQGGYGDTYGLNVKNWVLNNYRPIKNFQNGKAILYLRK